MNERDGFLKLLAENEDDTTTRLVYADWLDDRGEHEEADRQRKWPAAKEWLVQFCRANSPPPDDEDPYEWPITYAELVERAAEAVARPDAEGIWFHCGNNMTLCDTLRSGSEEFWRNWSIVTGTPLPPDVDKRSSFSCAC